MLPSWFTKLRDVKAGSKQSKQPDKPHGLPPTTSEQRHKVPARLAKSFSLRRASSKARNALFESDILDACRIENDVRPSFSSSEFDHCNGLQYSGLHKEATGALLTQQDECEPMGTSQAEVDLNNVDSWDSHVQSISPRKGDTVSKLRPGDKSLASIQKGLVVSDNETEDFVLTSETSSSFGSETSSADSSVSSKCSSCEEERHQGGRIWQEGFRTSACTCRSMQNDCDRLLEVTVTEEQKESSGCANLMSRLSQESAEIRRSLYEPQKGRQPSFFSSFKGSNDGRDGSPFSSNEIKSSSTSSEIGKRCTPTPILIERNVNESRSRIGGDEECALLDNSALKQQVVDEKMPLKLIGRRKMKPLFTFDESSLAVAQCSLQDEREYARSLLGRPEIPIGSILCAHQMSISQRQRRRQRGSSISAVLPPDLQGVVGDSLAFVKISDDPYEDFRQSMYEMIMEKDLEGSVDVEELLYCYLTLNSPEHHELIEEVFSDVWSAVLMTMR